MDSCKSSLKPPHVRRLFLDEDQKPVLVAKRRLTAPKKTPDLSQLLKTMTLADDDEFPRPGATPRKRKSSTPVKRRRDPAPPPVIVKYFPSETIVVTKNAYGQHVYRDFVYQRKVIVGKYVGEGVVRPLNKQDIEEAKDLKLTI